MDLTIITAMLRKSKVVQGEGCLCISLMFDINTNYSIIFYIVRAFNLYDVQPLPIKPDSHVHMCFSYFLFLYYQGIHAEGSSLTFFFGLFMWDAIFAPGVPDVFYNLYQTHPLDLYSLHFYEARKEIIDEQLDWVRTASLDVSMTFFT